MMSTRTLKWRVAALAVCLLGAALASRAAAGIQDLRVNELMARNGSTLLDEGGDSDDWVEILNTGPTPVNVEGMFLSDTPTNTQRWAFPDTVIPSGGYLIVWCDNEEGEGPLHTNFALDSDGEFIGLYEYLGIGNDVVDSTSFGHQARDVSFGRYPNGLGPFGFMPQPTPAGANAPHANIPPFFEDTANIPAVPDDGEPVTVVTTISDDSQILEAKLFYDAGGAGFVETGLFDDGAHGDEAAGDGVYGGGIPGFPADTQVRWYVWARDDSATTATDPEGAPDLTFSYFVAYEPPALYINELMAQNLTTLPDEYGQYEDWVEIYNRSDAEVNLGGMYLSDDPQDPNQWQIPDTAIPPRGFLLIWCDNDPEQGPLHAPFRLSVGGEFVGLYDCDLYNRVAIDTLSFGEQTADISLGRFPNGGVDWRLYDPATPGESNVGSAVDEELPAPMALQILALTNPVRTHASLRFAAPREGTVRLRLFDAGGRQVLARSAWHAAGQTQLDLDAGTLAAGVYLLRIDSPGSAGSARLVVVR